MNIIEKVKSYVEEECRKDTSLYGYDPFPFHFALVAEYAGRLADELGADKEVLLVAAWLHDIGSIIVGRADHHLTGARIAEEKLREFGYDEAKIGLVKACILHHRGSQQTERSTLEEQILAEADVLSNFDNVAGIFKAAFVYEKLSQGEAKEAVRRKLVNKYAQLHFDRSKELIKPKYEATMLLLS